MKGVMFAALLLLPFGEAMAAEDAMPLRVVFEKEIRNDTPADLFGSAVMVNVWSYGLFEAEKGGDDTVFVIRINQSQGNATPAISVSLTVLYKENGAEAEVFIGSLLRFCSADLDEIRLCGEKVADRIIKAFAKSSPKVDDFYKVSFGMVMRGIEDSARQKGAPEAGR